MTLQNHNLVIKKLISSVYLTDKGLKRNSYGK